MKFNHTNKIFQRHPMVAIVMLSVLAAVLVGCRDQTSAGAADPAPAASSQAATATTPTPAPALADAAASSRVATSEITGLPTAPDFELATETGEAIRLSDLRGRIVVLEWFNEQCPFVQRHYHADRRTMVGLADRYADDEVTWLAINSSHFATPQTNAAAVAAWDMPFPILDDAAGDVGRAYGARTTPHMFVIDREGHIVYQGAIDSDPRGQDAQPLNYVDQALAELLAGESVSVSSSKPYGCSVKYQ